MRCKTAKKSEGREEERRGVKMADTDGRELVIAETNRHSLKVLKSVRNEPPENFECLTSIFEQHSQTSK